MPPKETAVGVAPSRYEIVNSAADAADSGQREVYSSGSNVDNSNATNDQVFTDALDDTVPCDPFVQAR